VHDTTIFRPNVLNLKNLKLNVLNLKMGKPKNILKLTNHAESPPSEHEEEQTLLHL